MLIAFSGLPGTGKTTIARELARTIGGVHLRIDSIEQALRNDGVDVTSQGYVVAYVVAEDNLRLGRIVMSDCVNPDERTRSAWHSVAARAGVRSFDIEITCSDSTEHRRRVESRLPDISGHRVPTWQDVVARDYEGWKNQPLVVDTARLSVEEAVRAIVAAVSL